MTKTAIEATVEQPTVEDDQQAQADFDAGVAMEESAGEKPTVKSDDDRPRDESGRFVEAKAEPKAPKKVEEKPEYIQLTKQQFERLETAAKRTEDHERQMSKAFGTIGDVQKIVKSLQSQTPRGVAVKIPVDAFAEMEKDFPELAKHTRAALEATLKGLEGTGSPTAQVDAEEFERRLEDRVLKLAAEDLEDEFPDWQKIVGAVDVRKGEKPDENNAFRKWLATKDQAYQTRVNSTNSAGVITRAIRAFQSETKKAPAAPAKNDERAQVRASRIQDAVRPKGDGGPPPAKNADDEFEAGFQTG